MALAVAATAATAASDTTFLSAEEFGEQLLANVVRIRAIDHQEHGFGLIVGATQRHLLIATARHVVGGSQDGRIEVMFCKAASEKPIAAERVGEFDADAADVALLRVARPEGFPVRTRALADEAVIVRGVGTWLLGEAQQCGVAPRNGVVAYPRDDRDNLRIEFPGALGGASGGPVLSGYGVVGLITDASDLSYIVYSAAALAARMAVQMPGAWQLEAARNIPPTDPRAAQVDLSETLNLYLFSVRNLHGLLQQPAVPQKLFFDFSRDYNTAINRFRDARDRYDGALSRHWPPNVLPMWAAVRDRLWAVHEVFWKLNAGDARTIFETKSSPPEVQARMRSLSSELDTLQSGITDFLQVLNQGSSP